MIDGKFRVEVNAAVDVVERFLLGEEWTRDLVRLRDAAQPEPDSKAEVIALVNETAKNPNMVRPQPNGKLLVEKKFEQAVGKKGESVVRLVGEEVDEGVLSPTTAHPAFSFKELLSFVPIIGDLVAAEEITKDVATAGAEKVEAGVKNGNAYAKKQEEAEQAAQIDELSRSWREADGRRERLFAAITGREGDFHRIVGAAGTGRRECEVEKVGVARGIGSRGRNSLPSQSLGLGKRNRKCACQGLAVAIAPRLEHPNCIQGQRLRVQEAAKAS